MVLLVGKTLKVGVQMILKNIHKIKKVNAVFALLAAVMLLDHTLFLSGWMGTGGTMFGINLTMARVLLALTAIHGFLSLCVLLFAHDETADRYIVLNRRTNIQRFSGIAILVLLLMHVLPFYNDMKLFADGLWFRVLCYLLLFVMVYVHVAVSFSKAFITMGWFRSEKAIVILDKIVFVVCVSLLLLAVITLFIFATGRIH